MVNRVVECKVEVPQELAGRRLDAVLAELLPDYSRSLIKTWIEKGQVLGESGAIKRPRIPVEAGQVYEIRAQLQAAGSVEPEPVEFAVIHADSDLIVVNKPAGLVVHPGAGNPGGTLQNGLLHRFPELSAVPRFGLVHRLDAGTTGLLLVARTAAAHQRLTHDLQDRRIHREYRAVARGCPVAGGTIDEPLGRHSRDRLRMAVRRGGRSAVTHFRVLARFAKHSFLAVRLETGRTHQVRVHLAHVGHPLAGDTLYARVGGEFERPALHARELRLQHPGTGSERVFLAPVPEDMCGLLDRLAGERRNWDRPSWSN